MLALAVTATICSTKAPASFQISTLSGRSSRSAGMGRDEEALGAPSSRSPGGGASRQNLLDNSVPKPLLLALIGILDAAGELMRGRNVAFQTLFAIPLIHPRSSHVRARVSARTAADSGRPWK